MQGGGELPWEVTCRGVVDGIAMVIHMTRREKGDGFVEEAAFVKGYEAKLKTDGALSRFGRRRLKCRRERLPGPGGAREGAPRILRLRLATTSPASIRSSSWLEPVKQIPDTGFMARLLALCSLPRTTPGRQLQYKRVNGPYTLTMTAVGQTGLPFGNLSRLLLAWVCTEAVRTQSRELFLGPSLSGFMRRMGMAPIGGGSRGARTRLCNRMKRLFNAHIQLAYEDKQVSASVNSPLASRTGFWWNECKTSERLGWESKVELGEKFFSEIIRHPVPLDMNILKALRRSSLGIDFYLWLTYRTFTLKGPLRLSWVCLYRQFGVKPVKAGDNRTVDNFRTDCLRELKKIKVAWPDLNYAAAKGVLVLLPLETRCTSHVAVSARGVVLKSPLLAQNRSLAVPGGPGEASLGYPRRIASRAPESLFHKTPVISGSFPG